LNRKLIFWFALTITILFSSCFKQKEKTMYNDESDFSVVALGNGESVAIERYTGTPKAVYIPPKIQGKAVISISEMAFWNRSITSVTIPDSVLIIGDSSFIDCADLRSVTIGKGVIEISWSAFLNCKSLISIDIDENNTKYSSDNGILYSKDKTYLYKYPAGQQDSSFTVPNSVTRIEPFAFRYCTALRSLNIPDSVTSIDDDAFNECIKLTEINVDDNNTIYSSDDGILYNKEKTALLQYPAGKTDSSFTVPNGVTVIGKSAFEECIALEVLNLGKNVSIFKEDSFYHCVNLTAINVDNNNTKYSSANGILYDKKKLILYRYPKEKQDSSFTIPHSVTEIGARAFWNCKNLKSVTIPKNVTAIQEGAFYYCDNLAEVTFEGIIREDYFSETETFCGDLRKKYIESGVGTYTAVNPGLEAEWSTGQKNRERDIWSLGEYYDQ
jgi:hypothetical protein